MNLYDNILSFKGTWRAYQSRVLESSEQHLEDRKIHIVAAPGAGKTTLGIELIRRLGEPCLILSPRIVIRQQWLERIRSSFLEDGLNPEDYLSNNIKKPRLLTSITYQTLFCGMTHYKGMEEEEDSEEKETVDYSDFELVKTVKEANIRVICLDECHHLKSEWWKALENFMKEMKEVTVISLTATPPYDSAPAQWERYCSMCGPVDEEITVPELVREGSLCPHQDYVYFNYPSKEEQAQIQHFRKNADEMFQKLMNDSQLKDVIGSHKALVDSALYLDEMLDNPSYLSSLLIYCQAKGIPFSAKWMKILNVKKFPDMSAKWMEILLQGFLYHDTDSYYCDTVYREQLMKELKSYGLIERKTVGFLVNSKIEKTLINSKGKLASISKIAETEFSSMQENLRMLILTDYIRKEYRQALGNPERETDSIGVLPIFELLRRENRPWKLGILCGSLIILPDAAMPSLEKAAEEMDCPVQLVCKQLYDSDGVPLGYSEVMIQGKIHVYAQMITRLFEEGEIQILVGTKSLLGEGWDSPCINSLILASFVGSYVLSNQMRGRAIRTMPGNPHKTSNIWHLVCLAGKEEQKEKSKMGVENPELSEDFYTLQRRMEGFFGVSYDGTSIENGMERLNIIGEPYTPGHIRQINKEMETRACEREKLEQQWKDAVFYYEQMETVEECQMEKEVLKTGAFFMNAIGFQMFLIVMQVMNVSSRVRIPTEDPLAAVLFMVITFIFIIGTVFLTGKIIKALSPLRRLKLMAKGVLTALKESGKITSECKAVTEEQDGILYMVHLTGGTAKEKAVFAECMEDMLKPVDNQRYILLSKKGRLTMEKYYCVPAVFSKTREEAELFQRAMISCIGAYSLIYTRNPEGRRILLKARAKAFANRNERIMNRKKKVKGALE